MPRKLGFHSKKGVPGFSTYSRRYEELSKVEREDERAYYESLWAMPMDKLIADGLCLPNCIVGLHPKTKNEGASNKLSIELPYQRKLPRKLSFQVGDYCRVYGSKNANRCTFVGELIFKGVDVIMVAVFDDESHYGDDFARVRVKDFTWRLDKGDSVITHKRIMEALSTLNRLTLSEASGPLKAVIASSLSQMQVEPSQTQSIIKNIQHKEVSPEVSEAIRGLRSRGYPLNESQMKAIRKSLKSKILLLQGPPGTGKTSTASYLVKTLNDIAAPKKGTIGVFAFNNVAVDELMYRCMSIGLNCIRIGSDGEKFDSETVLKKRSKKMTSQLGEIVKELKEQSDLLREVNICIKSMTKTSDRALQKLINAKVSEKTRIKQRIGALVDIKRNIKRNIAKKKRSVLKEYDAVFCTCIKAGHSDLDGIQFAAIVIDECTQAVEPSMLIPLLKLSEQEASRSNLGFARAIMLGDQNQLPPMVRSMKGLDQLDLFYKNCTAALPKTLRLSMLERLILFTVRSKCSNSLVSSFGFYRLKTQYRMHSSILEWSNKTFYDGEINSGCRDSDRKLPFNVRDLFDFVSFVSIDLSSKQQFFFLDIDRIDAEEERVHTSYRNMTTALIVHKLVEKLQMFGIDTEDVGVITPYAAQRRLLERPKASDDLIPLECEVKTVDGFQGREKDVILLDTVRTNKRKSAGFISDPKRLNVALTRARRLVVIIGSIRTLSSSELWLSLIQMCEERKCIV